jgi:hypothetical protein
MDVGEAGELVQCLVWDSDDGTDSSFWVKLDLEFDSIAYLEKRFWLDISQRCARVSAMVSNNYTAFGLRDYVVSSVLAM